MEDLTQGARPLCSPAVQEDDHRETEPCRKSLGLPLLFASAQGKVKVLITRTTKQFLVGPPRVPLIPGSSSSWKRGTEHRCHSQVGLGGAFTPQE